jgi:uncharacterized zinc-type alcohol dehydrogenase-like protein
MECTSVAFTSSADKRDVALRMGAAEAASSKDARDIRAYVNRFDLLLCTAPAKLDWITYVQTLKPNGVLCLVGSPPGLLTIPPGPLLSGQRIVCGSDIGSPGMIREMLTFAAAHRIGAQIETLPLAEANAALARVRDNEVRYRMVLTV